MCGGESDVDYHSEVLDINCGRDFESIAKFRLSKKYMLANIFTSVALWGCGN